MMKCRIWIFLGGLIFFGACSSQNNAELQFKNKNREVPSFNVDSAYAKIVAQVKLGPRTPGSQAHQKAKLILKNTLERYAGHRNVFLQRFTHRGYEGDTLALANIIAAFNPSKSDRIMLCAHWDSRPRADQDTTDKNSPILGADDGASGVALLLEMARLFQKKAPDIGVDIILFDGEDYGREGDNANYFLGSRYWSNRPPVKNYHPRFGILFDMVAGKGAVFPKEENSMDFAPRLVNEIWGIAQDQGYGSIFIDQEGGRISDDHLPINQIRHIPTIDIVRHKLKPNGSVTFGPYWHTHHDNLNIIDRHTLKAVGQVLSDFVYNHL